MVLDVLLWRRTAAVAVFSPSTLDVYTALAIARGDRSSRDALFALMALDALLWRQAAAAVLSPSTLDVYTALAIVQGDRSSRDALVVRSWFSMPFFGVGPPPSLSSRRPHRTFVPISPSCRAISQVETLSLCARGSRCPSLASDRRRR